MTEGEPKRFLTGAKAQDASHLLEASLQLTRKGFDIGEITFKHPPLGGDTFGVEVMGDDAKILSNLMSHLRLLQSAFDINDEKFAKSAIAAITYSVSFVANIREALEETSSRSNTKAS